MKPARSSANCTHWENSRFLMPPLVCSVGTTRTDPERADAPAPADRATRWTRLLRRDADPEGRRDRRVLRRPVDAGDPREGRWSDRGASWCVAVLLGSERVQTCVCASSVPKKQRREL